MRHMARSLPLPSRSPARAPFSTGRRAIGPVLSPPRGALFFHLAPRSAVLADVNADLVACYAAVRDDVEAVIAALGEHRERHSIEYYYAVRDGWNDGVARGAAARAATFIYLNKTCYNG